MPGRFVTLDPARNRARFSTLTWQPAPWGLGAIVRRWGWLGSQRRWLSRCYLDQASAQASVARLLRRRLRPGYRVIAWS